MTRARQIQEGKVGWSCPSNIALVKYWGKKPVQLPCNPSLSMGLEKARTRTSLAYQYDPQRKETELHFLFHNKAMPAFEPRLKAYLHALLPRLPHLAHCRLEIQSRNTFPHSAGIASSASAMGALALCLQQVERELNPGREISTHELSSLARLGSGSACRSLYPGLALWGRHAHWPGSSDEYAIEVDHFHPHFAHMRDAILLIESGRKKVSSSAGHALMEKHPYATARFQQARMNLARLKLILEEGNWPAFIELMEEEALSLHALMMSSRPSFLLMKEATLTAMESIRKFRQDSGLHLGFTLDAGANVHLLYQASQEEEIESFIREQLAPLCEGNQIIYDQMGSGPQPLS